MTIYLEDLELDNLNNEEKAIINKFMETHVYEGDSVCFNAWGVASCNITLLDGYYSLENLKIVVQIMELLEEYQKSQKEKTNDN